MRNESLLLDTHIWLWLVQGNPSLSSQIRRFIDKASENNELYVSIISVWEIAMLEKKNRIVLESSCHTWIKNALTLTGIKLFPLTTEIAIESCHLSKNFHGDPADRILTATAKIANLVLVTRDKKIIHYSESNFINIIQA